MPTIAKTEKLTEGRVRMLGLWDTDQPYIIADASTAGLHLRIGLKRKTWHFYHERRLHGARIVTSERLGHLPDMNLRAARKAAKIIAGRVASGRVEPGKRKAAKFLFPGLVRLRRISNYGPGPPAAQPPTAQSDDRTLLQKLSDLLPARMTLASLAPDGGLLGARPNLASLGYDNLTAVYDISARVVYMPDGSKLEAHSGFGSLMDDPGHVNERNVGATPPNVYDLKPRERLFHGVQELRMIPVGDNGTLGRSGLLAHSYMLGPKGDSNGCLSIKNYEKFLKAFSNGEIKHLVVVPSLSDEMSARSTSQS
jgi:hypothetical protein